MRSHAIRKTHCNKMLCTEEYFRWRLTASVASWGPGWYVCLACLAAEAGVKAPATSHKDPLTFPYRPSRLVLTRRRFVWSDVTFPQHILHLDAAAVDHTDIWAKRVGCTASNFKVQFVCGYMFRNHVCFGSDVIAYFYTQHLLLNVFN